MESKKGGPGHYHCLQKRGSSGGHPHRTRMRVSKLRKYVRGATQNITATQAPQYQRAAGGHRKPSRIALPPHQGA